MAAEDDEIDILGDFSLDECLNKNEKTIGSTYSELLKCDYSVHPQWLLDTVTTANWYDNPPHEDTVIKGDPSNSKDDYSDNENQASTSTGIVEWTLYEKELLKKAMDIYGRDYNRISIFLGSKSSQDVKTLIEAEYGINLECEQPKPLSLSVTEGTSTFGEVLTEHEIPASIEEVICMVSTAEPTVPNMKSNTKTDNPRSILRKDILSYSSSRSLLKKSDNFSGNAELCDVDHQNIQLITEPKIFGVAKSVREIVSTHKFNGKNIAKDTKLRKYSNLKNCVKSNRYGKLENKSKFNISLVMNKKDGFSKLSSKKRKGFSVGKKRGIREKSVSESSDGIIEKPIMQIVTGSGQALPVFEGEQVIKIEKHTNSDAESDVDVDVDSDVDAPIKKLLEPLVKDDREAIPAASKKIPFTKTHFMSKNEVIPNYIKDESPSFKSEVNISDIPEHIKDSVLGTKTPKEEYIIIPGVISDLEKFLCPDFFEGRSAKTPERYMAIRSHLIESWRMCRPNYLTKTAARHGLRNCGDVNSIGKVHTLMEQLGAINLNCEQITYIRPLTLLLSRSALPATPHISQGLKPKYSEDSPKLSAFRQRKKKIVVDGDGGYTITHSEFGEICEAVKEPKQPKAPKKKETNLIYCKSFSEDHPAPFSVTISLSALILMDFHSHTSHAEVMGLLGGRYDPHARNVYIQHYVPCDSIEDSGTHCDMCPVSQSEAGEAISAMGLETVGWHHSHPLFPPWPSPQDLLTQQDLQAALSPTPCLAVILSPLWQPGRTSSQYRSLYVKTNPASGETLAFRFKTHIDCDFVSDYCLESLLQNITKILEKKERSTGNYFVDMINDICPNANVSYLDKCVSSISYHLKGCENQLGLNKCKEIIKSIRDLVR